MATQLQRPPELISDKSRIIVGIAGLGLIAASLLLFICPPTRATKEITRPLADHTGSSKEVTVDAEPAGAVVAMLVAGSALLAFGINGLKITSFSSPILNATAAPLTQAALQSEAQPSAAEAIPANPASGTMVDARAVIDGYLGLCSWNGIKVLQIARKAAENGNVFDFKHLCSGDARMTHDYAFAYLVSSSSFGLFRHVSDAGGARISVANYLPYVATRLDQEIERRYLADAVDAPNKRQEIERVAKFFANPAA